MDLENSIEVVHSYDQPNQNDMETDLTIQSTDLINDDETVEKIQESNQHEKDNLSMPVHRISDIPLPGEAEKSTFNNIKERSKGDCLRTSDLLTSDGKFSPEKRTEKTQQKSLPSQTEFMLNISLNNDNTSLTANLGEAENSVLVDQNVDEYSNTEDTMESRPPTPQAFVECSANEKEKSYSQDSQLLVNDIENISLYTYDYQSFHKDLKKQNSAISNSLRRSCDSQLSDTSCPLRINADGDAVASSSSSSSGENLLPPLVKRKKRKHEDTDCEDEAENSKKEYAHITYVSDDERSSPSPSPVDSSTFKYEKTISDFDLMMQKKRAERAKGRKRGSGFITSNDELIDQLIDRMEEAAHEDRRLNRKGLPAIKKVSILKYVISQLRKKDLQPIFLEHNILSTLTAWLSPLPSDCLPCLQIRDGILRLLDDFPRIDARVLRHSGIGRMLKLLREHPDETKENQERCNQLIAKWMGSTLDWSSEYKAMSKQERQQRDYEISLKHSKQKSKPTSNCEKKRPNIVDITLATNSKEASHPGEPGWVPRARVPQLSVRDYIKRPESKLTCQIITKTKPSRFEILSKKYLRSQRNKCIQSGVKLSIVGDKM